MGQQRRGSAKLPPGRWSLAVAVAVDARVETRKGKRDAFAADTGISRGRLVRLLDGESPWYLEDVERACAALGLDVIEFLDGLDPGGDVVQLPVSPSSDHLPAVASEPGRPAGEPENDDA